MPNTLPLTIQMGALPLTIQGTPQQIADAIAARLSIVTQQSLALFVTGSTEPASDSGPWLDTSTTIGVWKAWDATLGNYQPMPVADATLKYIVSTATPDPAVYQLWVRLAVTGKAEGISTYYNGAWHDVYEDVIATLTALSSNVFTPYGSAGSVLTSNGPGVTPSWSTGLPVGSITMYGGSTAPSGWLSCDGSVKAITSYPALFTAIGAGFGGDGITTFNVPDYRGRSPIGIGTGEATGATPWSLAQKSGGETNVIAATNLPSSGVVNSYTRAQADGNVANPAGSLVLSPGSGSSTWTSNALGSDTPFNIVHPVIGTHFIIRSG